MHTNTNTIHCPQCGTPGAEIIGRVGNDQDIVECQSGCRRESFLGRITTAVVRLYSDPRSPGLAYSVGAHASGPAGPDRSDIVSRADLRDTIADDAADAIAALRAAGLVVDVDRSRRYSDGMEADVTVTSWVAAARILERL